MRNIQLSLSLEECEILAREFRKLLEASRTLESLIIPPVPVPEIEPLEIVPGLTWPGKHPRWGSQVTAWLNCRNPDTVISLSDSAYLGYVIARKCAENGMPLEAAIQMIREATKRCCEAFEQRLKKRLEILETQREYLIKLGVEPENWEHETVLKILEPPVLKLVEIAQKNRRREGNRSF